MENSMEKSPIDHRKEFLEGFRILFNRLKEKVEKTDYDEESIQPLRKVVETYNENKEILKEINFPEEELQDMPSPQEMVEVENKYKEIFNQRGYEEKNGYTQPKK